MQVVLTLLGAVLVWASKADTDLDARLMLEIADMKKQLVSVKSGCAETSHDMLIMKTEHSRTISQLEAEISLLKDEVSVLQKRLGAANVMFSAYMTVDWLFPNPGDLVPFGSVTLNQGGHFDTTTSTFTCPGNGFYFFTYNLYSAGLLFGTAYYRSSASLVLDGQLVAEAYSENSDPEYYVAVQGASSVVVQCPAGGQVWLESRHEDNVIYGSSSGRTTFSGFLISYLDP